MKENRLLYYAPGLSKRRMSFKLLRRFDIYNKVVSNERSEEILSVLFEQV